MEGGNSIPRGQIISCLKASMIISKGCPYHIVMVNDLGYHDPFLESVPVVKDILQLFPDGLPEWEVHLGIDLMSDNNLFQFLLTRWLRQN